MADSNTQPLISIVIPIFNEEQNIPLVYAALTKVWNKVPSYNYELLFVNDGSIDESSLVLDSLAEKDPKVKYIEFSRNFGKEIATTAGIINSSGSAAILIDADLQHPPELIPDFIKKWEQGADMVIGIRQKNKREGLVKKLGSVMFYSIVNIIGETKIIPHATDFRLIDHKVMRSFNYFTEKNRITRGLMDWMGFKRDYIYFEANARHAGQAGYSYSKLTKLALSTFISNSLFPLKLAGYLGGLITLFAGGLGLFILVEKYILGDPQDLGFSGPAILAVINLFLVGIVLCCQGLMSLYIGNIHEEVLSRPIYLIRRKRNFPDEV